MVIKHYTSCNVLLYKKLYKCKFKENTWYNYVGDDNMDPKLKEALILEMQRQKDNIELIASENYVSEAILEL